MEDEGQKKKEFYPLSEIKVVKNVGRFSRAQTLPEGVFGHCTLLFGENGRGKSTLADVLRSLSTDNPSILRGRRTLDGESEQQVVLRFSDRNAIFEKSKWKGTSPRVAVYDSVFVNENVFSGDHVSNEHLKNQFGLVVGEEGVRRVKKLVELDELNRENNNESRVVDGEIKQIVAGIGSENLSVKEFLTLSRDDDIETKITNKSAEVDKARKAKELQVAETSRLQPEPTDTEEFRKLVHAGLDEISEATAKKLKAHLKLHETSGIAVESWLEEGHRIDFEKSCPFCGQELNDRTLVDSYSELFSESYKELAKILQEKMSTVERYESGQYRARLLEVEQLNETRFKYWNEAVALEKPKLPKIDELIAECESSAVLMKNVLEKKQNNLTEVMSGTDVEDAMEAWDQSRKKVVDYNELIATYNIDVERIKKDADFAQLPVLEEELKQLAAIRKRFSPEVDELAKRVASHKKTKEKLAKQRKAEQSDLAEHGREIMASLGTTINAYLGRLNAGFRIHYEEPNYKTKEPSTSYQILINEVSVSPRVEDISEPGFSNTLSAGDKSTLALALFLARVNADPNLSQTIVVLDDPFTSLDSFRRQFTADEIRRLSPNAGQVIVLSHDKNFLRLLWDKMDRSVLKSLAIQTGGGPGVTTIAPYDLELETKPRYVTERMILEEFVAGEEHEPAYVRTRLRTVCEEFYRRGDPNLFHEAANLDEIIRKLRETPVEYAYRGSLDSLQAINEYSRPDHHAEIEGDPSAETSEEELLGYCRLVLDTTSGM